jgi:hypothetical protein
VNAYAKTVCITLATLAISAAVVARPAEPEAVILPAPTVAALLQYLNSRPYQEVSGLITSLQRCLQDQVPDANGLVSEHGNCPEIAVDLRQMKAPHAPILPGPVHP